MLAFKKVKPSLKTIMKRRSSNTLFLLILVFAGSLAACGKPQRPVYQGFQNLRIEAIGVKQNVVAADLQFYNPNRYPLNIKQAGLDVYFNDRLVGHSALDSLVVLPGRDTSFVPLRLQASASDVLANAAQLLLNPEVNVRVDGSVKAGRGGVFVNIPVHYQGKQQIELLRGQGEN